jgi:hypothetical protein
MQVGRIEMPCPSSAACLSASPKFEQTVPRTRMDTSPAADVNRQMLVGDFSECTRQLCRARSAGDCGEPCCRRYVLDATSTCGALVSGRAA